MNALASIMLTPAQRARDYTDRLVQGIRPEQAARKPVGREGVIDTNHPVFVFGHLSLYGARVLTLVGKDPAPAATPETWEALFKAGAPCHDDPSGAIYPAFGEIVTRYFEITDAMHAGVRDTPDDVLLRENPNEAQRARFALVGHLVNFLINSHVMMHAGQVSAWRRCMGLASAM
ncbi:MAG: DinB family protein [Planctomycetota bacterium]|nr:DinB family protein [Planctomycetota bacterium]